MGEHQLEVTNESSENWHPRPLRPIARLLQELRSQASNQETHIEHHTCSGPSFLHNLLPILEPFLLLDPKLLYIEDRIIGRQQAPRSSVSHKVPTSFEELKGWSEITTPCDCDECAPWLYQLGTNSAHEAIRYELRSVDACFASPRLATRIALPRLSLRFYGKYEAMRLVRHHVAWLEKTYLRSNSVKDNVLVLQLQALLRAWNINLTGRDMRHTMSRNQQLQLIKLLNQVFFFGAIPSHRAAISSGFDWLPDSEKACFGIGTFNPIIGTQVLLHPTLYRNGGDLGDPDVRWRNRLGTMLHELCHAFLKAYTCRSCPMHDHCIGPRGHGRAWQILVAKMEEVATKLMGGYVDMGRYPSLLHDLQGNGRVPSKHDLEVLKFGSRWEIVKEV
ncbi:hypothetical protein BDU57DRAFT_514746 [Ampelomyces quisqualis]|uniref:SprT-like domain-containing protein n=1 Tax=Ampelomyces quisqualis TaxID=50730 RepID=A0A6A5QWA5_AMPQU|nr:hypothetical protein BDU57DRAFT_514746 [Ampelomyces quisqualis]